MSTPQANLDGREVGQPRGRGLGGSSQINFQLWSMGARDEFDHWADEVEDKDWAFDSILQSLKKASMHFETWKTRLTIALMRLG